MGAMVKATCLFPLQKDPAESAPATDAPSEPDPDRMYLDLTPVKSFLHSLSGTQAQVCSPTPPCLDAPAEALPADLGPTPAEPLAKSAETPELQVQVVPRR